MATFVCAIESLEVEGINCRFLKKSMNLKTINDVFLPHESNCTMFYQCGVAGAQLHSCGHGTIFSARNKDCRRMEEIECVKLERYLEDKTNLKLQDFYDEDY